MRCALVLTGMLTGCSLAESALTLTVAEGTLEADGTTLRDVTVCNDSTQPVPKVAVTLLASAGEWALATGENKRTLGVELTDSSTGRCRTEQWRPAKVAGAVRFEAKVGNAVVSVDRVQVPARVKAVTLTVTPPVFAADAGGTLKVGVDFTLETGGLPSQGTKVVVQVAESDPVASAALTDGPLVVGTRDSVDLLVGPTAKSVKLTATYDGPEGRRQACRVVQPLGATSGFACP